VACFNKETPKSLLRTNSFGSGILEPQRYKTRALNHSVKTWNRS